MNAALSCASGLRGTCQYPLSRSEKLKYLLYMRASRDSSILGGRVSTLDGKTVELVIVHAEPSATIRLLDQYHRGLD